MAKHRRARVADLRAEIQALRAELSAEVRTHRVVVESPDGFVRLRIDADDDAGFVTLRTRGPVERINCIDLVAHDTNGGAVGVMLTRDGNVVAGFESVAGTRPDLWIDHHDEPGDERATR